MYGTIALEEAVLNPENGNTFAKYMPLIRNYVRLGNSVQAGLLDIHEKRLESMDKHGVEYMVLSITSAGAQDQVDRSTAERMAHNDNNFLANEVKKNPARFGAFASLSMHDAHQAASELRRAVKELGMLGALVNDWQSVKDESGEEERKYYDTPEYDPFWAAVEELDVPVYFHPRYPPPETLEEPWASRKHLLGASVGFSLDLSVHLYAISSSGTLDRFPNVKIIVGHLGEGIPFNLWRASYWYDSMRGTPVYRSQHSYSYYWRKNFYVTTSGTFNTAGLKFSIQELGVDRCLYSIDTPYNTVEEAQAWWKSVDLSPKQKAAVARENAIKLLKLPLKLGSQ
ncbi:Amidohydrolase-like protein 2 [Pleurostoma richardsiae]|uniref:Amidohydrolase-like protein 2 n=1 Tax=Pleurostoma richardsiae TaxID=41990 RepID=A0AA38RIG6_9PEZI|nr:Amidohydrolase-like protein 2 [Pleurostoma richardsiae]